MFLGRVNLREPLRVTGGSVDGLHYGLPPVCRQLLLLILSYSVILHQELSNVILYHHPHLRDYKGALLRS
jgi:hypothetical protein